MTTRIDHRLAALKKENRPALVTFIMAGDPDLTTGQAILDALPQAGADIIELGMPFSDPMADGPVIQQGGRRALVAGQTLLGVLDMVTQFRAKDETTPIVLMGYYNPIYSFGVDKFLAAAVRAGVDGLIVVDLPAEEDAELCRPARAAGLNLIRLIPPTADDTRLPVVLENTSGFVYYVSMTGITGAAMTARASLDAAVARIKAQTDLPVAVGFGIKTAADAAEIGRYADAIVVGSVLVEAVGKSLVEGTAGATTLPDLCAIVADLAAGVRRART